MENDENKSLASGVEDTKYKVASFWAHFFLHNLDEQLDKHFINRDNKASSATSIK